MTARPSKKDTSPKNMSKKDIWIFGYGSLMWRPDFPHIETRPARLAGYHRALCVLSTRYRGTKARPGLVLGLDRGGSCVGRAFRVAARDADRVLAILHEREMLNRVYNPRWLTARTPQGPIRAYAFIVRRDHPNYAGGFSRARAIELVRDGRGERGTSLDYLRETIRHMDALGVRDTALHKVLIAALRASRRAKPSARG